MLPCLEKCKVLHYFGILCVNTVNIVLGKEATVTSVKVVPMDEDF
jgi:hypothetical protein